ncbi:conditioned medium factor (density-sensing factor) [Planoprotostelium fungivorum]|uniref:Conditioned medium factor (Density-sensing factor) n=1 Tax=Planoprotostelium fungivorum TaxID=1890364 RepID=A0A2P6N8I2_9EUKA|nr:conditioned medium factor (density-sensing factor) [Planoprotostelium fungivorum]
MSSKTTTEYEGWLSYPILFGVRGNVSGLSSRYRVYTSHGSSIRVYQCLHCVVDKPHGAQKSKEKSRILPKSNWHSHIHYKLRMNSMRACLFLLCLWFVSIQAFAVEKEYRKQLAGPPSEFHLHVLPDPSTQLQDEDSAFFELSLQIDPEDEESLAVSAPLVVDSTATFAFAVVSKYESVIKAELTDARGDSVDLGVYASTNEHFPVGDYKIPTTIYVIPNPVQGTWNLTLRSNPSAALDRQRISEIAAESDPNVAVLLWLDNGFEIYTHLTTYDNYEGSEIGLVATTKDKSNRMFEGRATVETAVMDLTLPSGATVAVTMKDDGFHPLDEVANDGIFVGTIVASEEGSYKAKASLGGIHSDGTPFIRTTQHVINVVERLLTLTGDAFSHSSESVKDRMDVRLVVDPNANATQRRGEKVYRAHAEVYGTNLAGEKVPVAWIGGMTHLEEKDGKETLKLSLDMRWAAMANATAPFVLENVYVQDPESQIPLSRKQSMKLDTPSIVAEYFFTAVERPTTITKEMRRGRAPEGLLPKRSAEAKKGLMLLHGYCSTENPWSDSKDLFTNGYYFLNPSASITNEQFAAKVIEFGKSNGLTAYAIIGHSQGGMVATHILNYYFTGLDNLDTNKRLVQSVGTPYQGTTAAGSAANMAKSFGVACGSNFDLSIDGAKLWLSGISADTRENVYYYTTAYPDGGFFGDYCSLPMNLILQYPNDGTTEIKYADLPGANNMGTTKKWCHTKDMKYASQCTDKTRNALMNKNAASN